MLEELSVEIQADKSLTGLDEVMKEDTSRERNKSLFQKVSKLQDLFSICEEENQRLKNVPCQLVSQKEDLPGKPGLPGCCPRLRRGAGSQMQGRHAPKQGAVQG